jgi:23S rRNA (uracil1939-C5)-methyltransferase
METINNMETIKIKIDSLAYGGYGVGRINSKVVFVSYAVPGDILKIEIFDEHKNYAFGRIAEIITPSPKRIAPACKNFGFCGGCDYLNMPYEEEIYRKNEIFNAEFKKIIRNVEVSNICYLNHGAVIAGAEGQYGDSINGSLNYRQKIKLKISTAPNLRIGFYKKLSHSVVDVDYCRLASAEVNELLKKTRNLLLDKNYMNANYRDIFLNNLSGLTLTDTGIGNITFEFKDNIKNGLLKYFAEDVFNATGAGNIFFEFPHTKTIKYNKTAASDPKQQLDDYFVFKEMKFYYNLPSFIQSNREQNKNLIGIITDYIKNTIEKNGGLKFKNALDLYCGFGNITLFLEPYADRITGVETEGFSTELGEKNIKLNKIKNIKFIKSNVKDFLEKASKGNAEYDIIVLDPPRAGIKGLVPEIVKLKPSLIIYVSCDTMTFLRDLKAFKESGYSVERINLIDMFPKTYHMEHIAFLNK